MKISDCCGADATGEMVDVGICPSCKEHCEFMDNGEEETIVVDKNGKQIFYLGWETEIGIENGDYLVIKKLKQQ